MNIWKEVKEYFSRFKKSEDIRRTDFIDYFESTYGQYPTKQRLDIYRSHLTKKGYLKRVGQGKYRRVKSIPADLPLKFEKGPTNG